MNDEESNEVLVEQFNFETVPRQQHNWKFRGNHYWCSLHNHAAFIRGQEQPMTK